LHERIDGEVKRIIRNCVAPLGGDGNPCGERTKRKRNEAPYRGLRGAPKDWVTGEDSL